MLEKKVVSIQYELCVPVSFNKEVDIIDFMFNDFKKKTLSMKKETFLKGLEEYEWSKKDRRWIKK